MDKQFQARWRQNETELRGLRQPNSAQVQTLPLQRSQNQERQAASIAHEHEVGLRELREQAESQPAMLKTQ